MVASRFPAPIAFAALVLALLPLAPQTSVAATSSTPTRSTTCKLIPAPPARVATPSKYRRDDPSKSTIDEDAEAARSKVTASIEKDVKHLVRLAYSGKDKDANCALQSLKTWAEAKSLTDMASADALLSRDHGIADIALALEEAASRHQPSAEEWTLFRDWLGPIAHDIVKTYETGQVGPNSRANNHRAWAGLATTATGFALQDETLIDWGRKSYDITACQVDADGHLPREMARASRALHYHLYALRPFAGTAELFATHGVSLASKCPTAQARLTAATCIGLSKPETYQQLTGKKQILSIADGAYPPPLKLDAIGLGDCRARKD